MSLISNQSLLPRLWPYLLSAVSLCVFKNQSQHCHGEALSLNRLKEHS